jgi:hypothetical protein
MSVWAHALYRCAWGHDHYVTGRKFPGEMYLPHGLIPGKPPKCGALLRFIRAVRVEYWYRKSAA